MKDRCMLLHRRRCLALGAVPLVAGSLGLAGCANLAGPRSVVYSEAELQALLARRFPLDRRMLEVLDVRITEPRVGLLPDQNRLSAELDVTATDRLFAGDYLGRLALTTALRVEPSDRSLRLKDVRVSRLTWDQRGTPGSERIQRLGSLIAERLLEDVSLHQFRAEQWDRLMDAGYAPPSVKVTRAGLELKAVPAR
jgi:hypothetical protein